MIFIKSSNIEALLLGKNIVIPSFLIKYYKVLKLDLNELLLSSYLITYNKEIPFDVTTFSNDLNMSKDEIMNTIAKLCEANLISMNVKENNNVMKEYLDILPLVNKITTLIIGDETTYQEEKVDDTKIYSDIENEFGRPLSPIEYETIKGWIDAKINSGLIHEALKEAVLNGVNNLKYIDKILFEWTKKGYKKVSDIKKKSKEEPSNVEIFDYDWLKDNE